MSAGKRRPFSPHEREIEPCFWSRAEKSERIYKKTHEPKLSNDNRARRFIACRGKVDAATVIVVNGSLPTS
jgi:hypothetical protein